MNNFSNTRGPKLINKLQIQKSGNVGTLELPSSQVKLSKQKPRLTFGPRPPEELASKPVSYMLITGAPTPPFSRHAPAGQQPSKVEGVQAPTPQHDQDSSSDHHILIKEAKTINASIINTPSSQVDRTLIAARSPSFTRPASVTNISNEHIDVIDDAAES